LDHDHVVGGTLFKKGLRLHCFRLDRDEIWQNCSSIKYAFTDRVGFSMWPPWYNFTWKSAAICWVHMQ